MRLQELFEDDEPLELPDQQYIKLMAILKQLAARIKDTGSSKPMNLNSVVRILNTNGFSFDAESFRDAAENAPLNDVIADIKGDDVVFVGRDKNSEALDPDNSTNIMKKMAKRAEKRRQKS